MIAMENLFPFYCFCDIEYTIYVAIKATFGTKQFLLKSLNSPKDMKMY